MTTLIGSGDARELAIGLVGGATLALAARILRRSSASARHLAWTAAVVAILALPLLTVAIPGRRLAILPATAPPPPIAEPPVAEAWDHARASMRPASDGTTIPAARPGPVAVASGPVAGEIASAPARSGPASGPDAATTLAALWLIGVIVVGLPQLVARGRLARLRRRWLPATDLARRLGTGLGLARAVPILRGPEDVAPMTWGTIRPVVLLPASAVAWSEDRLRAVLLHELAHVRRRDCLVETLAGMACAHYWFHPLAWMAAHRVRDEREIACDDLVLGTGRSASAYAGHLLAVARASRSTRGLAALATARPTRIALRLRAVLDPSRARRPVGRRSVGLVLASAEAAVIPLATVRLGAREATARPARWAEDDARMTVRGRVLDPDGHPVVKAAVAVVARRKLADRQLLHAYRKDTNLHLGRDLEHQRAAPMPRASASRSAASKPVSSMRRLDPSPGSHWSRQCRIGAGSAGVNSMNAGALEAGSVASAAGWARRFRS